MDIGRLLSLPWVVICENLFKLHKKSGALFFESPLCYAPLRLKKRRNESNIESRQKVMFVLSVKKEKGHVRRWFVLKKDTRMLKIKKHYSILINGEKYQILGYSLNENHTLSTLKTKIRGQHFPYGEDISVSLPTNDESSVLTAKFHSMFSDSTIEYWEYEIT